jgi:hypothetical protein
MKVRYNPAVPTVFIVLGVVNGVLGLLLLGSGGGSGPSLFLGPLFLVLGILQATRTYFEFEPAAGTISVAALLGPAGRQYGGGDSRLSLDGDKIRCTYAAGRVKTVPVKRYLASAAQWRAVVEHIARTQSSSTADNGR